MLLSLSKAIHCSSKAQLPLLILKPEEMPNSTIKPLTSKKTNQSESLCVQTQAETGRSEAEQCPQPQYLGSKHGKLTVERDLQSSYEVPCKG